MSNITTTSCFAASLLLPEADALQEISSLIEAIQSGDQQTKAKAEDKLSDWTRNVFANKTNFSEELISFFSDPVSPDLGGSFSFCEPEDANHRIAMTFYGDAVDLNAVAEIIRHFTPSILPFRFGWACESSRKTPNGFFGGVIEVTADTVRDVKAIDPSLEGDEYVIHRVPGPQPYYYRTASGYGRLEDAKIFTEASRDNVQLLPGENFLRLPK